MANRPGYPFALLLIVSALVSSRLAAQAQQLLPARQPDSAPSNNPPRDDATGQPGGPLLPNGQPAQPQHLAVQPPFVLTPQEQAELDQVLAQWEKKSDSINTLECSVTRLEYDPIYGEPVKHLRTEASADLKFAAPDKGLFRVNALQVLVQDPQTKNWERKKSDDLEYWTCDGKSTYEVKNKPDKQIIERPIPPQLQGKSIIEGPLPFVFGAKANMLKQRYFLRILASDPKKNQIWIEALPKTQKDAANYAKVELILNSNEMLPAGIQIYSTTADPNGPPKDQPRTVFTLIDPSVNSMKAQFQSWFTDFSRPNLPFYKHVLESPQGVGPPPNQQAPPPNAGMQQASRVKPAAR
jgi:TIGR03009 family protein